MIESLFLEYLKHYNYLSMKYEKETSNIKESMDQIKFKEEKIEQQDE